eukprot:s9174_g3.t1
MFAPTARQHLRTKLWAPCLQIVFTFKWIFSEVTLTWLCIEPDRATGRKQESVDIRGGMYQTTLNYFLEAWAKAPQSPHLCFPRAQFVSANSLCLLTQYEDLFGGRPYKDCDHPDWRTFPGLDPMVATVLEWGHSMDDEQWSMMPSNMPEFKVSVSEWLLNSTSAAYLLNDRDYDSHTALLIEVHANQYSGSRMRAMNRNPETVREAADRRKARQKANNSRLHRSAVRTNGHKLSTGSGSVRQAKGKDSDKGKSKGKSKGKGKGKN